MSLPRYEEYNDSCVEWIGNVPKHWAVEPLKRGFSIVGGSTPKSDESDYWDGGVVWVSPADLSRLPSMYIADSIRKITEAGLNSCGTTMVPPGSIVLSTRAPIGSLAIATKKLCTNQGCKSLVPNAQTSSHFFAYVLLSATTPLNLRGKGTTFLELSSDELASFKAPYPPLDEQTAIAAFLDRETAKIDALIAEQEKLIALLTEKRQATISHAVTQGFNPNAPMKDSGVAWLGEVPAHWEVKRFGDACASISTGPFGTALGSNDYVNGGVPVINPSHIVDNNIVPDDEVSVAKATADRLSFWTLHVGDIVVARRGELGRAAIVQAENDGWICGTGSLSVTPNEFRATAGFLHAILQSTYAREWLNQASVGSTMANLNEGILGNLPIALPGEVDEQMQLIEALTEKLSKIRATTILAEKSVALLRERRSALIAAAVTGQIDVRDSGASELQELAAAA